MTKIMNIEFLKSFKRYFFSLEKPNPPKSSTIFEKPKIEYEENVYVETDPYYNEMYINKHHLKFCYSVKRRDINEIVYCKDCSRFRNEKCSLEIEIGTKISVRKIIDSKITKTEMVNAYSIILSKLKTKENECDFFNDLLITLKNKLSFDEHLSICLFYILNHFGLVNILDICWNHFSMPHAMQQVYAINNTFKFYRTMNKNAMAKTKDVVGRDIFEVPTIESEIKKLKNIDCSISCTKLNCINKCPFFEEIDITETSL